MQPDADMNERQQLAPPPAAAVQAAAPALGQRPLAEIVELAQQLQERGDVAAADRVYTDWLASGHRPGRHIALFNHGAILQAIGQNGRALQAYQEALQLEPGFGQACVNMGLLLERLGESERALQVWGQYLGQRFLREKFDEELQCTALNHMGRVHEGRKHYELAERALEQSLSINPRQPGVIQHWIHIRQKACKWPVYKPLPGISHSEMLRCTSPLAMLALVDDPLQQLLTAQSFVNRMYPLKEEWLCDRNRHPGARWRVGLVSADLREHAVGFLVPAFIQGLDRSQYALHAYDYTKDENTPLRQSLKQSFDHVTDISGMTDREAAQAIAHDGIDVLIDLHGLSAGARPGIFALHPAPRQVTYLGYMGSTGMPWFDQVIVDPVALPQELASYFTEQPIHVSGSYIPLTLEKRSRPPVTRREVALPDGAFVMAAFGNVYKITQEMFACWMRILQRLDHAVLWLIDDNPVTTSNLRKAAHDHGVPPERLVFMARCDHETFCARLGLADVYLDSYPYNCGSTSNDVINAGVPIVTLYGKTLVSRMGLSMLSELGMQDLAADSYPAYEDKVVEVALKHKAGFRHSFVTRPTAKLQTVLDGIRYGTTPPALLQLPTDPIAQKFELKVIEAPTGAQSGSDLWKTHRDIRHFLVHASLDSRGLYGFFTPQFRASTGLDVPGVERLLSQGQSSADVVLVSAYWDLHCLHRNPFLAWTASCPGLLELAQAFVDDCRLDIDLASWIQSAHRSVHGLSLLARKPVWYRWLQIAEHLMGMTQDSGRPLAQALNRPLEVQGRTSTAAQLLYPLLMNLVLKDEAITCQDTDMFSMPAFSGKPVDAYPFAVECDALKQAYRTTGEIRYLQEFERKGALMTRQLQGAQ